MVQQKENSMAFRTAPRKATATGWQRAILTATLSVLLKEIPMAFLTETQMVHQKDLTRMDERDSCSTCRSFPAPNHNVEHMI